MDIPYSSIRTYYGRLYEGKFITGAIAGAMASNDRIGYNASYMVPECIICAVLGVLMGQRLVSELRKVK